MKYLVLATAGPGFVSSDEEALLLKDSVLPSFDMLLEWEKESRVNGGLPVGDRAFAFIAEAVSNAALDAMLRRLPLWGELQWEVTPLISFAERVAIDREQLARVG